MKSFANKSKSRRPKFLFNLKINELTNIPQSSGYCFVKWHLKDGTGTTSHTIIPEIGSPQSNVKSSSQSRGATPRVLVKSHRAHWNYSLQKPVQVKLVTDKNKNLNSKEMVLEVYFEFLEPTNASHGKFQHSRQLSDASSTNSSASSSNSNVYTQKVSRKMLLGVVEVNIAEYVNREQHMVTSRFLLQKSKVNSILSLGIQLELTRGSFDDFQLPSAVSSGQLPNTFRNGITEVFDESSDISSPVSSTFLGNSGASGSNYNGSSSPAKKTADLSGSFSIAISNPFVEKLYQKTFQVPWDPRPGEFTPKECVEDILDGGDGWAKNEKGINLIDIDALHLAELERDYDAQLKGVPMNMNYGEFDKRAFLERRVGYETHTSTQDRGIGGRKKFDKSSDNLCEDNLDDYDTAKPNDFKSWTIGKVLP